MNIINRTTLRSMTKNRVRTIVTIIGIMLSAAMFTAVLTIITSLQAWGYDTEIHDLGNWHYLCHESSRSELKAAAEDPALEYAAFAEDVGYAECGSQNRYKPYIFVLAADRTYMENMAFNLIEGRYPENPGEIMLPEHLSANGGVSYAVGDELELGIGKRSFEGFFEDGSALWQRTSYLEGEELVTEKTVRYKVVGICERTGNEPYSAPGYTAVTLMDGAPDENGVYECAFRLNKPRDYESFYNAHPELSNVELHDTLLMYEGVTRYENYNRVITNFSLILMLIIFIGSVSLIYSAFSISVSERTKQFGILSSVGATRGQLARSVLFEALSLSAIAIPLGIGLGVGGIAVTFFALRGAFTSIINNGIMLSVHVTVPGMIAAALIALVTVLVSAWIPSMRARRVSPIEAIRQTKDVSVKAKKTRYPALFKKIFGAEGLLAKKYYSRSAGKYRATVLSLAMSVLLFVSASAFCMYMTGAADAADSRPNYDASFGYLERADFERLRGALAEHADELKGYLVADTAADDTVQSDLLAPVFFVTDEKDTSAEYRAYINRITDNGSYIWASPGAVNLYMDDVSFRELLEKNGLSDEGYFGKGAKKAVLVNSGRAFFYGDGTRESMLFSFVGSGTASIKTSLPVTYPEGGPYHVEYAWSGNRYGEGELEAYFVRYSDGEVSDHECDEMGRLLDVPKAKVEFEDIPIGGIVDEIPINLVGNRDLLLIRPFSAYSGEGTSVSFVFLSDNTEASIKSMKDVLQAAGVTAEDRNFYDANEENRAMNNIITIVKVFSYGFITLISLISVANVFNTVTTNVALRRRDYAMLRSMGMSAKGMNRMSNLECLIYGSRSLMIGLPLSILVTWVVYMAAKGTSNMRFTLPWTAIGIAVVSVFVVVFVSMLYSTGKLKKDNPIDALKDENI